MKHSNLNKRWAPGFSLIELLTVIGIIAGLMAVSTGVISALSSGRLSAAKNTLTVGIDAARRLAIREQRSTVLLLMKDSQSGQTYYKTLIETDVFLRAAIALPANTDVYLPRFIEAQGFDDEMLGANISLRGLTFGGNGYSYWQEADDFYDDEVTYTTSGSATPPAVHFAIRFNADGSLFRRDRRGNSYGVFLTDGNPRYPASGFNSAADKKRTVLFQTSLQYILYNERKAENHYDGDFEKDHTYAADREKDFGKWVSETTQIDIKRLMVSGRSGKAISVEVSTSN